MKLVVNEITEEIGKKLVELGFKNNVGNTWCKKYGIRQRFTLIINPLGEPKNIAVIGYSDDDLEDVDAVDACYNMSEIYEDLQLLIDAGIVERR